MNTERLNLAVAEVNMQIRQQNDPSSGNLGAAARDITASQWERMVKTIAGRIEEERSKIGPLDADKLEICAILDQTELLERLINDYLRLQKFGQKMGF